MCFFILLRTIVNFISQYRDEPLSSFEEPIFGEDRKIQPLSIDTSLNISKAYNSFLFIPLKSPKGGPDERWDQDEGNLCKGMFLPRHENTLV